MTMYDNISPEPDVIERSCGGWLAISPDSYPLRIGVTCETEAGVRHKFYKELGKWLTLSEGVDDYIA